MYRAGFIYCLATSSRSRIKRLAQVLALVFLSVAICTAQTVVVTRNVNLRPDPSTKQNPVANLLPGTQLQLVEPSQTANYYHVRTPTGQIGFVWGKNVQIQDSSSGGVPEPGANGAVSSSTATSDDPVPLLQKGHPVGWWFVFKFNSGVFPGCGSSAVRSCLFGGTVQNYRNFSQQFVYASSEAKTLQTGTTCAGDTTEDPIGATFEEVYDNKFNYVVWNDQFYDDPTIQGCSKSCSAPWGHSKGMLAWSDSGEGLVLQVTTPSWPAAGSRSNPRKTDGNTLGCVADNDVQVSQHFFALKLSKDDVIKVLKALQNASVVTDPSNLQVVKNGGPGDIQNLVRALGTKSDSQTFTKDILSSGIELISKPSRLNVPAWQMVSAVLGGVSLRTATWWANPKIYSTTNATNISCWDDTLGESGAVEIAMTGHWNGQEFGLTGGLGTNFNHAKIGVSTSGTEHFVIFGDMNQQGTVDGPNCSSSQNGRGGLFYVVDDPELAGSITGLIAGDSAPTKAPGN